MSNSLVDNTSDLKFIKIVNNSTSLREIAKKLGFANNLGSSSRKKIQTRIDNLGLKLKEKQEIKNVKKEKTNNPPVNHNITGNIGLGRAMNDFIRSGSITSLPINQDAPYDLIPGSKKGKIFKVQVKATDEFKDGKSVFKTTRSNRNENIRYTKEQVDYFYLYSIPLNEAYLIPFKETLTKEEVCPFNIIITKEPTNYHPDTKLADDYLFENKISEFLERD